MCVYLSVYVHVCALVVGVKVVVVIVVWVFYRWGRVVWLAWFGSLKKTKQRKTKNVAQCQCFHENHPSKVLFPEYNLWDKILV